MNVCSENILFCEAVFFADVIYYDVKYHNDHIYIPNLKFPYTYGISV